MKKKILKTRFFVWLLGMLVAGVFGVQGKHANATDITASSIGNVYSETENGNSVVGLSLKIDNQWIGHAFDVWKYTKDDGWQFQYVKVNDEISTNQYNLNMGKYIMPLQPTGSNRRFLVVGGIVKNIMPECYKIETVRFQMGDEISREYEYSDSSAIECVSSEYSLHLALLQNTNVSYGGSFPQGYSCHYNVYSGVKICEDGDIALNATGAGIVGKGAAYYHRNYGYKIESLPTAEKPQDKYRYEFDGWYTQAEGGTKLEIGDIIRKNQQLYAHWKTTPVKYEVTCVDVLNDESGTVLGENSWEAEYGEVVSGSSIGENTEAGVYYTGREYFGCSSAKVGSTGAKVYRYFKNSDMSVVCMDIVQSGPEAGVMLGTNLWNAPYTSVVSGGAMGCDKGVGTYYKGYQYISATTQKVEVGGCTVYRYFMPIQYDIQFVANCASGGSMASIRNCYYGHTYTLTKNSFVNRSKLTLDCNADEATCDTSYLYVYQDFAGWSESPDGEVLYSDQSEVVSLTDNPSVKKLYAVWSDKEVVITAQPKRLGYEFAGWSRNPNAEAGEKQFQISGNEVLYAIWKPAPVKYHVQYYKQNLDQSFQLETEYELSAYTNEEISLEDLEDIYPGFWLDEASSSLKGTVKADGSLILTAYYRRGEYSICFDYNGGNSTTEVERPKEMTGLFEEEVMIPEISLKKQGYDFAGWGIKPDSEQIVAKSGEAFLMPNHNQVLYAIWIPRNDTKFSLIPYYENVSGTGYIQGEVIKLLGTTDSSVKEGICEYYNAELEEAVTKMIGEGYHLVSEDGLEEKRILADGTTSVVIYFDRERYCFTYEVESTDSDSSSLEEIVLYGQIYCFPSEWKNLGIENVGCYVDCQGKYYYPGDFLKVTGELSFSIVPKKALPSETEVPVESNTPVPTSTVAATNTPAPTSTVTVANTPKPTNTPVSTNTAVPTNTPVSTDAASSEQEEEAEKNPEASLSPDVNILNNGITTTPNPEEVTTVLSENLARVLPKKGKSVKKGNLVYRVTKSTVVKKTVKVVGTKKNKKRIEIPSNIMINGYSYKVTAIGNKAFSNQKKLRKVIVGDNIKKIGKKAFAGNKKLKKVIIRTKSIKSIGKDVWKGVSKKCSFQYSSECSLKSKRLFQKAYRGK